MVLVVVKIPTNHEDFARSSDDSAHRIAWGWVRTFCANITAKIKSPGSSSTVTRYKKWHIGVVVGDDDFHCRAK
jgi:hypothetical protein